ncbi:hypothetical protein J6590_036087 [Homalodisca vitripennis]|nr:hypothetical protein J6590_036087 [Homalodisca vitripennis]
MSLLLLTSNNAVLAPGITSVTTDTGDVPQLVLQYEQCLVGAKTWEGNIQVMSLLLLTSNNAVLAPGITSVTTDTGDVPQLVLQYEQCLVGGGEYTKSLSTRKDLNLEERVKRLKVKTVVCQATESIPKIPGSVVAEPISPITEMS